MESGHRPLPAALAEKFLWEVLLTDKWNHLFEEKFPIFPKQLNFCPTKRTWGRGLNEDIYAVIFEEENRWGSRVVVGMRANKPNERAGLLWPASISLDIFILDKRISARVGFERFVTPRIVVVD